MERDEGNPAVDSSSEGAALSGAKGKMSRKKLLIMAGAAIVLLALVGGGAFFLLSGKKAEVPEVDVQTAMTGGVFLDVLDITVNLSGSDRQPHFLKMSISIEVGSDADKAWLEKQIPHVIDQFQVYLRELRIEDLSGSAGIYRLREELLDRVRSVAGDVPVKDVLFREILVQ
ncbi:MAG: hypothetical protein A2018_06080 [Alphaproteobacteria bacterium GWF2_58_20]|nr:MAG: hypothetical protein A2018_06080 [Alphaproteobacteria bacterium GWF2_58_20]